MEDSQICTWFEELKRIWLEKDISALGSLLAEKFQYYEDPFLPPLETWSEVEAAWQEVKDQNIKKLEINTLIDSETEGLGSYNLAFVDSSGVLNESKGAYYLKLDSKGKAIEFRQWWTAR